MLGKTEPDISAGRVMMRKTVFFGLLMMGFCGTVAAADTSEFSVCVNPHSQTAPAVDGHIVVWQDNRNGTNDIYGCDLLTQQEFPVCTQDNGQSAPDVGGRYVVWQDSRNGNADIYGYDLQTGDEFLICTQSANQYSPAVDGRFVVWQDTRHGNNDIYAYDLAARHEIIVCTRADSQTEPAVSGGIAVWRDNRNADSDIYALDLQTGLEFPVCTEDGLQLSPDISGEIVVWRDERDGPDIYSYNLTTQTERPICTEIGIQDHPVIDGKLVVWQDARNGNNDIYAYNLNTRAEFPVCTEPEHQYSPAVSDYTVVWQDARHGNQDIYAAPVDQRAFVSADTCADAPWVVEDEPFLGTNTAATGADISACGFNDTADVWNRYIPARGGTVTITTDHSTFDTVLSVFEACSGAELACNDDYSFDNPQSQIVMDVVKGKTYTIRVAGFNKETGDYDLLITHGDCANRPQSDLNGDCRVDLQDLAVLAAEWLTCGHTNPDNCAR